jgi:hypothetical protein
VPRSREIQALAAIPCRTTLIQSAALDEPSRLVLSMNRGQSSTLHEDKV